MYAHIPTHFYKKREKEIEGEEKKEDGEDGALEGRRRERRKASCAAIWKAAVTKENYRSTLGVIDMAKVEKGRQTDCGPWKLLKTLIFSVIG